jgi:AcrR family transcriptional regulator
MPATRKTKATFESLLVATRESIRRAGGLSPEAVAEAAGVSAATLYAYFGSKDALLAAAFDVALADINQATAAILSVERLLEEGLETTAHSVVRTVAKRFSHDARLVRLAIARLPEAPEIQQVYRRRQDEALQIVSRFIRLGGVAGQIRTGDEAVLARTVLVILQGLQNPLALQPGAGPVVEEIGEMVYRLLVPSR